ncbi:MAG TPA: hypothetical protein VL400_27660 [Polyangiaceae bacterium]|jgi:hypothetical protein|nr:hypothetical protein [Polyangiaceae bacterium]
MHDLIHLVAVAAIFPLMAVALALPFYLAARLGRKAASVHPTFAARVAHTATAPRSVRRSARVPRRLRPVSVVVPAVLSYDRH